MFGWDNTRKSCESLTSVELPKERKIGIHRKDERKRFQSKTYRQLNSNKYTYFETSKIGKLLLRLFFVTKDTDNFCVFTKKLFKLMIKFLGSNNFLECDKCKPYQKILFC